MLFKAKISLNYKLLIILAYLCHLSSSIINISEGIITYKEESCMPYLVTYTHNLKTQEPGGLLYVQVHTGIC